MRSEKTVVTLKCDICCQEITDDYNCTSIKFKLSDGDRDVGPAYVYYDLHSIYIPYGQTGLTDICKKCLIAPMKKWIAENES